MRRTQLLTLAILTFGIGSLSPLSAQDDAIELSGLVVTATPLATSIDAIARHVTVLTRAQLERRGDRSVGEALRGVPGLAVVRGGSFGAVTSLFSRGGESDHTLILIDGVQVNAAGGAFDLSSITTDQVERIEIVRGPASALYGSDAMGGVINVITRSAEDGRSAHLEFGGGSFSSRDIAASAQVGADRMQANFGYARRATDGILDFNNESISEDFSGRLRYTTTGRSTFDVTLRRSDAEFHYPTDGSGAVVDTNSFTHGVRTVAGLGITRPFGERVVAEARVGVTQWDGGTDDAQDGPADTLGFYAFTSQNEARRSSAELRAHLMLPHGSATAGLEIESQREEGSNSSMSQFGPSSGSSMSDRSNRAGFVHIAHELPWGSISSGARLEDNERYGTAATWQFGVSSLPFGAEGPRIRAAAGTAIKEPTFFETFAQGFATGNPDLDPERSSSWELGVEQTVAEGRLHVGTTFFDQDFTDLIQYTFAPPNPGDPNYFNVAAARSRGLESRVSVSAGDVTVRASHTLLETEVTDSGFDSGPGATFVDGEALLRRPKHAATLDATLRVALGSVYARWHWVGSRSDRDFSTFPATPIDLDAYGIVSVGGAAGLSSVPVRIRIQADNLFDTGYEEVLGFAAPGRTLRLWASWAVDLAS